MRLKNTEYLYPVVADQRKVDRETCRLESLPPTSQREILSERAVDRFTIPSEPPPSLYRFLNACNAENFKPTVH